MKIVLEKGAKVSRAHETDAGLDLYSREDMTILPGSSAVFDTGVHVQLPKGTMGLIASKSGLNIKWGLTSDGIIDCGYTGSIKVKLYNHSRDRYEVKCGDKISQLIIVPIVIPELEYVDKLEETERGNNGFGSSGR
jgi:dUTP pyrophosphatase